MAKGMKYYVYKAPTFSIIECRTPNGVQNGSMSESKQPFTDHVTRAQRPQGPPGLFTPARMVAGLMTVLAVVFLFLWSSVTIREQDQQQRFAAIKSDRDEMAARLAAALAQNQTNLDQISELQGQVADLQQQKEAAEQMSNGLEREMRNDLESKDVTISKLQGKLTVSILDRVMFDSGEAVLKPDGQTVMQKIADLLAKHPELKIHVTGHTDNVPIRPGAHSRFASNWELSTARALAAVHYLTELGGVDPHRVGAVGYGEFRPIADNSTAEGRAMNRRIAITILPDELAAADTMSVPKPAAVTNAAPVPSQLPDQHP